MYDPWVNAEECRAEYGIDPIATPDSTAYDAIIVCVAHREFAKMSISEIRSFGRANHLLFDVKGIFPRDAVDARL